MKEDFASHELVLKLEKIGFDNKCFLNLAFVSKDNEFYSPASWIPESAVWTPLWQQIFKWFRDKGYDCAVINKGKDQGKFYGGYISYKGEEWSKSIGSNHKTYEEARTACIEKLIEIIENEK